MANPILARRAAGGDVLITDDVTPVRIVWPDFRSADGHSIRIEWEARVACVDSPADRQLLAEAFLSSPDALLGAVELSAHLRRAVEPDLRRGVEIESSDDLLNGSRDVGLSRLLATTAGAAAFASGLSVLPPYALRIESPSRERDRRLADVRERLASLQSADARQATALAEAARALADGAGARVLSSLRLADPLDLLRAAAIAAPEWSLPTPPLWIVAGTRLARVDPTRPVFETFDLGDRVGPLRSVRDASIRGRPVLLVGGRDGVTVVDRANGEVVQTFHHATGSDFGFNAACFIASRDWIAATHSSVGVVAWRFDAPDAAPSVFAGDGCRSVVAEGADRAVLVAGGHVARLDAQGLHRIGSAPAAQAIAVSVDGLIVHDEAGHVRLGTLAAMEQSGGGQAVHAGGPISAAAGVDLVGMPRALVARMNGGLVLIDFAGAPPLPIGPAGIAARALAARPGFVAALSIDRSRVLLIDLARPDTIAVELHVTATLGNRAADVWFESDV